MLSYLHKKHIRIILIIALTSLSSVSYYFFNIKQKGNATLPITDSMTIENISLAVTRSSAPEKGIILYIADTEKSEISEIYAKSFANLSYYVVKIDSNIFLKYTDQSGCINFPEILSNINQKIQLKYSVPKEILPILVGNNNGANIVYNALAQANKGVFHAGISIHFSPKNTSLTSPCLINKFNIDPTSKTIIPSPHLPSSWYVFQSMLEGEDAISNDFIGKVHNARKTISKNEFDNSLTETTQILQWLDPRLADQISSDASDSDLPLIEVTSNSDSGDTLAILLTGDGGWAEIDKEIAMHLSNNGIPTVALDSLSYFWKARTPEETSNDIDITINAYLEKWHKKKVILIGYSFGADVLPFIVNRLSEKSKKTLSLVALLGMGKTAAFEFRLSSWMNADKNPDRALILPEIMKMTDINTICIYGLKDPDSNCTATSEYGVKAISMEGDHHFNKEYELLVNTILKYSTQSPLPSK